MNLSFWILVWAILALNFSSAILVSVVFDLLDMCMVNSHIVYKGYDAKIWNYRISKFLLQNPWLGVTTAVKEMLLLPDITECYPISWRTTSPANYSVHTKQRQVFLCWGTENKTSFQCNSRNSFAAFRTDMYRLHIIYLYVAKTVINCRVCS